jgi:hypothetical protein
MPQEGFWFPYRDMVTSHHKYDKKIKEAIVKAGVRFHRSHVVPLLVEMFEVAAITCLAVHTNQPTDTKQTALTGAIDICRRGTSWASRLFRAVFVDFLLSIRAARRMFLLVSGFDDTNTGSWGRRLGEAVDNFDVALSHCGWAGNRELLAMEAADDEDDEDGDEVGGGAKDVHGNEANKKHTSVFTDMNIDQAGGIDDRVPNIDDVTSSFLSMDLY